MSARLSIAVETIFHGRCRNECWFEPSAARVPAGRGGTAPAVMVTASQLNGCDIGPHHYTWTRDRGRRWSNPAQSQGLQVNPLPQDIFEKPWVSPFYHRASDTLLLLGRTCFTQDTLPRSGIKGESHAIWSPRARGLELRPDLIASWWDPEREDAVPWQRVAWQDAYAGAGIDRVYSSDVSQRLELEDGSILCPVTVGNGDGRGRAGVLRMVREGERLRVVERGTILVCDQERGLHEPSLVRYDGRFLLTLRNDLRGYVASSRDGLSFAAPVPWTFDDGEELGSYNTQQHWLCFGGVLYLVYTRRSPLSGGVVRHRAPLFLGEVDPERLCVRRDTERVVIPANGARMGNFCTLNLDDDEAWVITGEWLQALVEGYREGMPFYADAARGTSPYNRIQYVGNLLLARLRRDG